MHFKMLSPICFNLDLSKILSYGNELKDRIMQKELEKPADTHHLIPQFGPEGNEKYPMRVVLKTCGKGAVFFLCAMVSHCFSAP